MTIKRLKARFEKAKFKRLTPNQIKRRAYMERITPVPVPLLDIDNYEFEITCRPKSIISMKDTMRIEDV